MTDYSGRFNVRLPVGLHQALAEHAEQEGVSLNTAAVALIAGGLGYATKGKSVRLSHREAETLRYTAGSMGEDLDSTPFSPADVRAYESGMRKLGSVR